MEDKLRLNNKLYGGFEGIIGRHDFFLNWVYITSIGLIFYTPATIWFMTNCETMEDVFNINKMFLTSPIMLKLWLLAGLIAVSFLLVSNIFRRLNDINGQVKNTMNIVVSSVMVLIAFSTYLLPIYISFLPSCLSFIILLVLFVKKGAITSKYPYDVTKVFNWGAFLGTWIWGLFNKSYIPLWYILLHYTPWGFYFALVCGLKGNEWAFKNKKWDDVKAFNRSQEKQTAFWAIFIAIIAPILTVLIVAGLVIALASFGAKYAKEHPEAAKKEVKTIEQKLEDWSLSYFESYEITKDENKFYVLESDWKFYDFTDKKNILEMAASVSAEKRRKAYDDTVDKSKPACERKYFSKSSELPRTKIYGKNTGKLLGEFVLDEDTMENASAMDIIKAAMKAYRFYKP